jgi:hypothetical protein
MTAPKAVRILCIALTLCTLLVFATGVVSDWNHQSPTDDAHCPYCHLGHQTPVELHVSPSVSLLKPVASLPLPEDSSIAAGPVLPQGFSRAPPAA